jgi:hypothetical protein
MGSQLSAASVPHRRTSEVFAIIESNTYTTPWSNIEALNLLKRFQCGCVDIINSEVMPSLAGHAACSGSDRRVLQREFTGFERLFPAAANPSVHNFRIFQLTASAKRPKTTVFYFYSLLSHHADHPEYLHGDTCLSAGSHEHDSQCLCSAYADPQPPIICTIVNSFRQLWCLISPLLRSMVFRP